MINRITKTLSISLLLQLLVTLSVIAGPERQVELDGQSNFRDVGGYQTSDGRRVKWGEVYRSGELHKLSDADVEKLDAMGIKAVANFLTEREIESRGHDRLPDGTREIPLPMETGNLGEMAGVIQEARGTGDFSKVPVELNPEIHRVLINEGREYYATLLREIGDPSNRPMVYHCSHGVHRTGTATAILLSALGVPWETVREDYLLSNKYRANEVNRRTSELRLLAADTLLVEPAQVDMTNINAFYILQPEYIDASLDEAVKQYGSMENYIREGLGISDKELASLREQLLVPEK
ncbi:MAG: tyrosine-protein phosphatase [Thiotrichales bacterium]|nr:MAG: tyrosine-protein phosphatase [Thiotrichales bacterium]